MSGFAVTFGAIVGPVTGGSGESLLLLFPIVGAVVCATRFCSLRLLFVRFLLFLLFFFDSTACAVVSIA